MAHKILGQRFMERDATTGPAWHRLGRVFDRDRVVLPSEAAAEISAGLKIGPEALYYMDDSGNPVPIDYTAIVRQPTDDDPQPRVFGVTSDKWAAVSYPKLAGALDELGRTYPVETCGLIDDGSLFFMALKGPDFDVKGDAMQDYFIVNLSNKPGDAHKVLAAPVRVVCSNTNLLAERQAKINIAVPHSANAEARIKLAADLVAQFRDLTTRTQEAFQAMASTNIDAAGLEAVLSAAWPNATMPTELRMLQSVLQGQEIAAVKDLMGDRFHTIVKAQDAFERDQRRVQALRDAGRDRFESFDPANLRGTVWAAYNAVTEVADWRNGAGADRSAVWGTRAREKSSAFSAAMALVN